MSAKGNRYLAQQNGESKYMSEKPCKRNHISLRVTNTGSCTECIKINERARYHANPEKTKIKVKQKYQNNPEKFRAQRKEWYYKNVEEARSKAKIFSAKRRASKLQRTPLWLTDIDYERINNEYKLADLLTKVTGSPWHVDHIIPLQGRLVSGFHVPSNLRAIPEAENVSKSNTYNVV